MSLDEELFYFINGALSNPILDVAMIAFGVAGLLYVWLAFAIPIWVKGYKRESLDFLVTILAITALTLVIKYLVGRERPSDANVVNIPLDYSLAGEPSFPSGHASRAFAASSLLSFHFRKWAFPLFFYSVVIGFSRIYTGYHYPSDVIAGALLGSVVGILVFLLSKQSIYSKKRDKLVELICLLLSKFKRIKVAS